MKTIEIDGKLMMNKSKDDLSDPTDEYRKEYLNKDGSVANPAGYHKALYAAMNADTIANHFYEQGKADAVKEVNERANIPFSNIYEVQELVPEDV